MKTAPSLLLALVLALPSASGAQDHSTSPVGSSRIETRGALAPTAPERARDDVVAPATAGSAAAAASAPRDLSDLQGWVQYKARTHATALPLEARIFYRRGLLADASGMADEGTRWVRGAAELDPSYVAPHLTLAAWALFREPSQALLQYAAVIDLARENFLFQLAGLANMVYTGIEAVFLALLAAGFLIVVLRSQDLLHPWRERLARSLSTASARWWSWSFVVLPYFAGLGVALPTVMFLGFLWPALRARERSLFVALCLALATAPWTAGALGRMAAPLDESRAPLYGVPLVEGEPWSRDRQERLAALTLTHPENPYLHFALAWTARRGGDLATAESAYHKVLERWPQDNRALNDLGNVLAMQGRQDEALELYQRAFGASSANAAAYFNASQIYTQRYEYRPATEALSRASALNFELVKSYQSQATEDGVLPLVDQWIAPPRFWQALATSLASPRGAASLPPAWRGRIEASGWKFSLLTLLLAALGLTLGILQHRSMPLRACSNCQRVVCRRCAQRRRELALCPRCATLEERAESPEFASVLLLQHRRQLQRRHDLIRTAVAAVIPGFGLLAFRRVFTPVLLLALGALFVSPWISTPPPFGFEPTLAITNRTLLFPITLALLGLVYAWSLLAYIGHVVRARAQAATLAAPVRSRSVQPTTRAPAAAA